MFVIFNNTIVHPAFNRAFQVQCVLVRVWFLIPVDGEIRPDVISFQQLLMLNSEGCNIHSGSFGRTPEHQVNVFDVLGPGASHR